MRANELVHSSSRDGAVAINFLIETVGVAEIGGEERQLVGSFAGFLHRRHEHGLNYGERATDLGVVESVPYGLVDLVRDLVLHLFGGHARTSRDIDDE